MTIKKSQECYTPTRSGRLAVAREGMMTNETMSWIWIGFVVLLGVALLAGHQIF